MQLVYWTVCGRCPQTQALEWTLYYVIYVIYQWLEKAMAPQYSCLENPIDGGAWWAAVHGVAKSWTRLSDFTFTFCFHALEKEMATHSSVLAWTIPGTVEPGGLPSMGSHRVRHDWSDLAAAAAAATLFKSCVKMMGLLIMQVCVEKLLTNSTSIFPWN